MTLPYKRTPSASNHFRSIDGVRGIGASFVFIVHYVSLFGFLLAPLSVQTSIANFIASVGRGGVDLFFALSGFLIYASVLKPTFHWKTFLSRRVTRIYPVFLVVLSVYLLLSAYFPEHSRIPSDPVTATGYVVENIFLLPGVFNIPPIITIAWSLSYEFTFYVFMAIFATATGLFGRQQGTRVALMVGVLSLFGIGCALGTAHLSELAVFWVGIFVYEIFENQRLTDTLLGSKRVEVVVILLLLICLGAAGLKMLSGLRTAILFAGILPFLLCCLHSDGLIQRLCSWAHLRFLGSVSYSFYLIQGLVLWGLRTAYFHLGCTFGSFGVLLPVCFALTIAAASILFLLVERPFLVRKPEQGSSPRIFGKSFVGVP
ncbi:MAG TPA: acyltransferase [Bryobacteraceae bacterium]